VKGIINETNNIAIYSNLRIKKHYILVKLLTVSYADWLEVKNIG
jgi:hypothetical protein